MNIGILGSGNVGGTLGRRWSASGHRVLFSSRDPQSAEMKKLAVEARAATATVAEAVQASDVLLLATPWPVTQQVLKGAGSVADKVLIDATNPLLPDLSGLALGTNTSGAEQVALWAPSARVVKAFSTVGFNVMQNPKFPGGAPVMFYCGDDASAKETVRQLVSELGFDARDAGPLSQARLLEPFAMLWISLALKYGLGREFAFQLMRR